jgi:glyoxylase-like metal-dependent hydrolase (beta-lactamase superfamily II)
MTIRKPVAAAAAGVLALSVSLAGLVPAVGAPPGQTGARAAESLAPTSPALRLAVRAVGGARALTGLRSFEYTASGRARIHDEGLRPGGPASPGSSFDQRVRYRLGAPAAANGVRVDAVRTSVGADRNVHEVINGRRGFIRGVDANFSSPARKAMTGDRAAAIREQLALLNPHVLLRQALRRPGITEDAGTHTVNGRPHRVLVLDHAVAPVRLFVDTRSGEITRLRTFQHDYLRRDVRIEVRYQRWTSAGDGLRFPEVVAIRSDGERLHREVRSDVTANPTLRGRAFRIPSDVDAERFDPELSRIGQKTGQWLMSFVNLGFIKDGGQTTIDPQRVVPGVTLLGGVANNSLVVRRDSGVVVLEGALHDHRAEAVIGYVRDRYPRARITHVVTTHHHSDHAGGQRAYVARGARAVVHEAAAPFFRQVFAERDSSILPDRLDRTDRRARVAEVPSDGSLLLTDSRQPVEVFPFDVPHSVDMTVTYLHTGGVLFVSDVYTPGTPPGDGGQALDDLIRANGLDVQWIAGGHGGVISYADFLADLAGAAQ